MNAQRAAEIAASPVLADVTLDGVPVYIQHVDEASGEARVYPLGEPEHEKSVPVRLLVEHPSLKP